jgi:hypothetical protein
MTAASSYGLSHTSIEEFTGIAFTDMMINGEQMTLADWIAFCTTHIEVIAQVVHRYCNVPTFDPGQPEALITEYRSGKKASDDWDYPNRYLPEDSRFYLLRIYYPGGTVNGTVLPAITVYEDVGGKTAPPEWVLRKSRLSGATPEVDAILITNSPTANGTIQVTLNNTVTATISVTTSMTIAQVCSAIVSAGAQTDSSGYIWTPSTDSVQYVWWTCNTAAGVNMVQVNTQSTGVVANAYVQTSGSAGSGGDYETITKGEITQVSFYNNIPAPGENNVKLVYYTGFAPTSKPYYDIKFEILRVFKNLILAKKNIQAVLTITANGGRDFQGLTNQYSEGQILSHMEESLLKRYRRTFYPGGTMTD